MKDYSRAIRRHHRNRLKQKRKSYWGGDVNENAKVHLIIDTPKPCSCFICGNPRKYWNEKTTQERQHEEKYLYQISTKEMKQYHNVKNPFSL